jgi:prepilin-type N-terminal cleavage/methylation domain-containing protein
MKTSETARSRADAPDRRGFTLVELLVTALVLGILASISMRVIDVKEREVLCIPI